MRHRGTEGKSGGASLMSYAELLLARGSRVCVCYIGHRDMCPTRRRLLGPRSAVVSVWAAREHGYIHGSLRSLSGNLPRKRYSTKRRTPTRLHTVHRRKPHVTRRSSLTFLSLTRPKSRGRCRAGSYPRAFLAHFPPWAPKKLISSSAPCSPKNRPAWKRRALP